MTKKETIDREQLITLVQDAVHEDNEFWAKEAEQKEDIEECKKICESMLTDNAHLDRLLVARKYDSATTLELFWEQVRFQARHNPKQIQPSVIPNALPSGAWRLCGHTRAGFVISNYKLEFWQPDKYGDDFDEAIEEYTRYVCYMIELMIASMKDNQERFVVLFDLTGFYMSMVTKKNVRFMIRKLIYVAQAQYPERLERVYLVNAPFGFETAWSLIKALLDSKTSSKIKFCTKEALLEDIDPEVLSVTYGGQHEEYPIPSKSIDEEAI